VFVLKWIVLAWVGLALPLSVHAKPENPVVLVVGDSLSAGYGVAVDATWVALLQQRLAAQGYGYRVVNASISGDTTGAARARLPRALELHQPAIVILELGGNDGLRGLPLRQVRENFEFLIEHAQAAGAKVVLIGMRMPPNYGPDYTRSFEQAFADLAREHRTAFVPFLLQPIALDDRAFQADRMHPVASAQPKLRDHVWTALSPLLN
jgi:acyl-CoA thioesterase-1